MALNITPVTNHRTREKGMIIYPVYSRRSAGLSIGINLFPDKKTCQFDCPYCEVFPFSADTVFSIEQMEEDLRSTIASALEKNIPIKDICFSGNGEPTLSCNFGDALKSAENIRKETCPSAKLVIITNGSGLLQKQTFFLLKEICAADTARVNPSIDIWLKLDAGTPEWYQKINRCPLPYDRLIEKIKEFTSCAVVTIQTMLCAINEEAPCETEERAWEALVCELAVNRNIRKVQIYGKARPAPEDPLASNLPDDYLGKRAASLLAGLKERKITIPVESYI
jgi:histidinol dehydrogenase